MRISGAAVVSLVLALGGGALADAGTATSSIGVSATVSSVCTISAGALGFGAYNTLTGTQVDATATLTVACTKGSSATVTLDQGANANTGSTDAVPLRRMKAGTSYLSYALYTDTGRATVWGNTSSTGSAYTSAGAASANMTVYGRVAASQDVPSGSYADTVTATISF